MRGSNLTREHQIAAAKKKRGKPHRRLLEWNNFGKEILEIGMPRFLENLERADDKEFNESFLKILEYFKPKLGRIESENNGELKIHITRTVVDDPSVSE